MRIDMDNFKEILNNAQKSIQNCKNESNEETLFDLKKYIDKIENRIQVSPVVISVLQDQISHEAAMNAILSDILDNIKSLYLAKKVEFLKAQNND